MRFVPSCYALVASMIVVAVSPAEAKARPKIAPLFVVSDADAETYLVACARTDGGRTRFVAGPACAGELARKPLALEMISTDSRSPLAVDKASFGRGAACPGPAKARFTTLKTGAPAQPDEVAEGDEGFAKLVVPAGTPTLDRANADAALERGIEAALAKVSKRQRVRAITRHNTGPSVLGLVDLDRNGTFEIVIRDTSLFLMYSGDGKRLLGEIGCYFGG